MRTEGEIDPATRMVHAIAQVTDPYGRGADPDRPPLAAGMYVQAEIAGVEAAGVAILPRAALRMEGQHVLVVDESDRLHIRPVEILRTTRETIVVSGGVEAGERVIVSALDAVVEGMPVRVVNGDTTPGGGR